MARFGWGLRRLRALIYMDPIQETNMRNRINGLALASGAPLKNPAILSCITSNAV
jgi:hypothetical protein